MAFLHSPLLCFHELRVNTPATPQPKRSHRYRLGSGAHELVSVAAVRNFIENQSCLMFREEVRFTREQRIEKISFERGRSTQLFALCQEVNVLEGAGRGAVGGTSRAASGNSNQTHSKHSRSQIFAKAQITSPTNLDSLCLSRLSTH